MHSLPAPILPALWCSALRALRELEGHWRTLGTLGVSPKESWGENDVLAAGALGGQGVRGPSKGGVWEGKGAWPGLACRKAVLEQRGT